MKKIKSIVLIFKILFAISATLYFIGILAKWFVFMTGVYLLVGLVINLLFVIILSELYKTIEGMQLKIMILSDTKPSKKWDKL